MKKINFSGLFLAVSVTLAFLVSCSNYFTDGQVAGKGGDMHPLALADGSGYLSSDDHNEITPFLYRDLNSGRAWLFFASDRDGDYNIYYAEMDANGKFFNLTKMTNGINTGADEMSPVIFSNSTYSGSSLFISYIQISNNSTNIFTALINSNFDVTREPSLAFSTNATHLSIMNKTNYPASDLVICTGDVYTLKCYWDWFTSTNWAPNSYEFQGGISEPIYGSDGFTAPENLYWTPSYQRVYILESVRNTKHQFYFGALWSVLGPYDITNFNYIPSYTSSYDDGWPCIDLLTDKVYFSSKRYGKGFWNLYRYNHTTFDLQFQWNLDGTNYAS